jgi:hypothetical protein
MMVVGEANVAKVVRMVKLMRVVKLEERIWRD